MEANDSLKRAVMILALHLGEKQKVYLEFWITVGLKPNLPAFQHVLAQNMIRGLEAPLGNLHRASS